MADIRTFRGVHTEIDIEITLTADFDILTNDRAIEINNFWIEPDSRLAACDDDARLTVVRLAAQFFIGKISEGNYFHRDTLNKEFDDAEGWGGHDYNGIRLLSFDGGLDLEFDMIEVEEIEGEAVANG